MGKFLSEKQFNGDNYHQLDYLKKNQSIKALNLYDAMGIGYPGDYQNISRNLQELVSDDYALYYNLILNDRTLHNTLQHYVFLSKDDYNLIRLLFKV